MAARLQENDLNLLLPADLTGEIERLQEELRIERDRTLRALADFKNYRRRIERDGNKLAEEGKHAIGMLVGGAVMTVWGWQACCVVQPAALGYGN